MLGELFVLSQIYLDTHAETERDARLVEQLLSEQMAQFDASEKQLAKLDLHSLFSLDSLSSIPNLRIQFIDEEGRLLDSNHVAMASNQLLMRFLAWALEHHVGLLSIIHPVVLNEQHVGDIIITQNLDYELTLVAKQALEILLPWFFLFVVSSLVLAYLFSVLLSVLDPLVSGTPARYPRNSIWGVISSLRVIQMPLRLLSSTFALNQLFEQQKKKVVDVQEDERKRMAAELHDELGQHLTALRFELDKLATQSDSEPFQTILDTLKQRSQRMSDIFRSNLDQLRPPELAEFGLSHCLHTLVTGWQQRHPEHQAILEMRCHERLMSEQGQLVAYRVIQECLTNISRHAGPAIQVQIRLYRQSDRVIIKVADNGQGCVLTATAGGYGLLGMKERLDALSGALQIASQPGQGMQVLASIPLSVEK